MDVRRPFTYFLACATLCLQLFVVEHAIEFHADDHPEFCEVCVGLSAGDASVLSVDAPLPLLGGTGTDLAVVFSFVEESVLTGLIRAPPANS